MDIQGFLASVENGGAYVEADLLVDLGMRAALGRDGGVDLVSAHMYFNLADRKGAAGAAVYRQDVAQQMTRAEIVQALKAARHWLSLH
ncbi:hypothetical protein J1C48_02305 [Jiella sp. CQZ9-1]|uniref:Sel1 repeat family protein n=1 Tax=Jiella flava TaxID=2816857 RepID=A0A939FXM1_9HYPH|nr:hypothetical protein [Jiella flava]